jgi:3-oxoacyl-[acyl-carrier-protein] synthase III
VSLGLAPSVEWIEKRVGISLRRTALPLSYLMETRNSDVKRAPEVATIDHTEMIKKAAQMAMERAGITADQIGLVVADPGGPWRTPPVANRLAAALGIDALAYDAGTACASFGLQLHLLAGQKPETLPDYILVAIGSPITWLTDYSDKGTSILFGDASAAAILSPRIPGKLEVLATSAGSDSKHWQHIRAPGFDHFVFDGLAVHKFAIEKSVQLARSLMPDADWDRLWLVCHQANRSMLDAVTRFLEVPPERHLHNIGQYGNTGQASAPSVLSEYWDSFRPGDRIVMPLVGGGLTWAGALMQCRS